MRKRGFTLIEMTIVTVIIGILAGALLPRLSSARDKTNNMKMLKETTDITNALDMYYQDYTTYPISNTCNWTTKTNCTLSGVQTSLKDYLTSIPIGNKADGLWTIGNGFIVPRGEDYAYIGTGKYYILSYVFVDTRDGQKYKAVRMPDGKWWMAENLNYKTSTSSCYNNDDTKCTSPYGRTYSWDDAQLACPNGRYLPSDDQWSNMLNAVESIFGGVQNHNQLGGRKGTSAGWQLQIVQAGSNGKDSFGFSFFLTGTDAGWSLWSSTPYNSTSAISRTFQRVNNGHMVLHGAGAKMSYIFVRCIRD